MNIEFEYKGVKFSPYRNFTDNELNRLWEYTADNLELNIDFDRDEFYAIAQNAGADVDIFIVGRHYVSPMGNCLRVMRPENAPVLHCITYKEITVEAESGEETSVAELLPAISDEGLQDFYPTPKAVSKLMLDSHINNHYSIFGRITRDEMIEMKKECWEPLLNRSVKTILEPSAGRGDLADALKYKYGDNHRSVKIDCIEVNPDLRAILKGKGFRVVHDDFLTFRTEFRYDLVVMNPPFSSAVSHVKKAMDMQRRSGGLLIALVNAETIRNPYTRARKELLSELEELDAEITFVRNGFTHGARSTDVETAIIKVAFPEPKVHESDIYSRLTKEETFSFKQEDDDECNQLLPYEYVERMVQNYNLEIKLGLALYDEYRALAPHILEDFEDEREQRNKNGLPSKAMLTLSPGDPNEYIKEIRRKYWAHALNNPEIYGRLTSDLQREWSNRVDKMSEYDFTVFNIKEVMLEMMNQVVVGVNDAIMDYFDKFTRYAQYDGTDNVHYYSGWKTNKAYKVNKKIILPCWGAINNREWSSDYGKLDVYEASKILSDIEKVFAYLDDGSTPSVDLTCVLQWAAKDGQTRKIKTRFFEVSFFKKGTMHIVFSNQRILDAFNIYGARKRNWLPETYGVKTYENMTEEEQAVIDSFQGAEAYAKVMMDKQFYLQEPAAKHLALMASA